MESGQWLGLATMVAMCLGLVVWIVYVMKKEKRRIKKSRSSDRLANANNRGTRILDAGRWIREYGCTP